MLTVFAQMRQLSHKDCAFLNAWLLAHLSCTCPDKAVDQCKLSLLRLGSWPIIQCTFKPIYDLYKLCLPICLAVSPCKLCILRYLAAGRLICACLDI